MRSIALVIAALGCFGAIVVTGQAPAPTPATQTGPGVQALNDAKFPAYVAANCKTPPAGRGGGRGPQPRPIHRAYAVTAIPGVIAAGEKWRTVWTGTGNNADGPVATPDGGMLFAQNSASQVMKLDRNHAISFPYTKTNTGGALAMNKKGALFIVQRGLPQEIWQLAPVRRRLANSYMGEPLDCAGTLLNDLTADSKGGVYFTKGGVHYADAKGVVTRYGTVGGNGIILSPDEKTLYVTNGDSVAAFDVQASGALANQRMFVKLPTAGGDGLTVDSQGRLYITAGRALHVAAPDGKLLGSIPSPVSLITAAFAGPDKKTMYAVTSIRAADGTQSAEVYSIPMVAQGYQGRAK